MDLITIEEVNSIYDAIGALPEKNAILDNLVWIEMKGGPYGGVYETWEEIVSNVFDKLGADWDEFKVVPGEFIQTKEAIAMVGNYTGISKKNKNALNARVIHLWRKKDGKYIFEQFADTALLYKF